MTLRALPFRGGPLAALLALVALGCSAEPSKAGSSQPSSGAAGAGTGGGATSMPATPVSGDVGTIAIHQVSAREYNNTVRDLLGTRLKPGESFQSFEAAGFDTLAAAGVMNSRKVADYFSAASTLADDLFTDAARRSAVVTCQPAAAGNTTCAESIIKSFGLRAFRRPLEAPEVADLVVRYQAALAQALDHNGAIQHVVRIMLTSPQLIYRMEFDPDPTTVHALSGYELASRLSYLVWSSMPDATLLANAESGEIKASDKLAAEVDRLLADPRSSELVDNFAAQWLGARRLNGHVVDTTAYPAWTPALGAAMQQEMGAYFDDFLHGDQTYDKFLTSQVNFVDAGLAALYGLPAPGGTTLTRVQNTSGQRTGFLGLAGFLTHTSRMDRTAPSIRGKWIVNSLKCMELELPPNLTPPPLGEPAAGQTVRQVLEGHRANPSCAPCHNILDPVGLGLEHFDAIGRYRDTYTSGQPVDSVGMLTDGSSFDGLVQLADAMSKDPGFVACAAHKLFVYGLGRTVDASDGYVEQIVEQWRGQGLSLKNLLKAMVVNDTFRSRHGN
jgi:Protein of unknown function (DUF1592)/Protein of unknown function (DUF1588)/Protein of unknown function (DUF1595)/Protein of unknown function (DUF1585)/Protein of unknown function (DUF1587)